MFPGFQGFLWKSTNIENIVRKNDFLVHWKRILVSATINLGRLNYFFRLLRYLIITSVSRVDIAFSWNSFPRISVASLTLFCSCAIRLFEWVGFMRRSYFCVLSLFSKLEVLDIIQRGIDCRCLFFRRM